MRTAVLSVMAVCCFSTLAPAQGSPHDAWQEFLLTIQRIDLHEVRQSYSEKMKKWIGDDRTNAGRATLSNHKNKMYALLVRDYAHAIIDEEVTSDRAVFTMQFTNRKDTEEKFTQEVILVVEDGEGKVEQTPTGPPMFALGKSTIQLAGGILFGLIVAITLYRKFVA